MKRAEEKTGNRLWILRTPFLLRIILGLQYSRI